MADARRAGAPVVGRTGILPAQLHEGTIVEDALPYVEAATILMVALDRRAQVPIARRAGADARARSGSPT